jgi:Na+/H+ antiporter NhaD/arsenite permease-like protein
MSATENNSHSAPSSPLRTIAAVLAIGAALGALVSGLAGAVGSQPGGIPLEYMLFAATLLGITASHRFAMPIAGVGLVATVTFKLLVVDGFSLGHQVEHEWITLLDLLGLLVGFGILSDHFERSGVPERIPRLLPKGAPGAFALLAAVFVLSSFLDNIAAAMIGGGVAYSVFKGRVHIAYLAGIVVSSNAGGAGSVIGDTTTTMMWIDGIPPSHVFPAYLGSIVTLLVSGTVASIVQNRHQPLADAAGHKEPVDGMRLLCVAAILVATVSANLLRTGPLKAFEHVMPLLAVAIWGTILAMSAVRKPTWSIVPSLAKSAAFLLMLVCCASLMPLEKLPEPSVLSAFAIGGLSSVFDNIPLTKLALNQGGYDWGIMAFAVGVGGSMLWFGSTAGVALCTRFPEGRSAVNWLRHGWHVPVGYVLGFWTIFLVHGWEPDPAHPGQQVPPVVEEPTEGEAPVVDDDLLNIGVQSGVPDASGRIESAASH